MNINYEGSKYYLNMVKDLEEVQKILKKYDQEHLLYFFNKLDENEKNILIKQIKQTNFKRMDKLYTGSFKDDSIDSNRITPLPYFCSSKLSDAEKNKYITIGENIIKQGKVAVITLAGGQGTRLGFKGPKGCYELDLDEKKSLFEVIFDKLNTI